MKFIETSVFANSFGLTVNKVDWWIRHGKIAPEYVRKCGSKLLLRIDAPVPKTKRGRDKCTSATA